MEQRAYVTKAELDSQIQSVKIDISKGSQNPAHSWIRKLDYSKPSLDEGRSFYEGKKATPADIASGLISSKMNIYHINYYGAMRSKRLGILSNISKQEFSLVKRFLS